jgi:hypothetical protein
MAGALKFPSDASLRSHFHAHRKHYEELVTILTEDNNVTLIQENEISIAPNYAAFHPEVLDFPLKRFEKYCHLLKAVKARQFMRDFRGDLGFTNHQKDSRGVIRGWGVKWMKNPPIVDPKSNSNFIISDVDRFVPNVTDSTTSCVSPIEENWVLTLSQTNRWSDDFDKS